jgi:tRNA pseudouridine38-40 synthase
VHALSQIVAFDSARPIAARGWLLGVNRHLPPDVRIQRAAACPVGYHPRFESLEKTYRYVLALGIAQNPLQRHRAYQLGKFESLDVSRMREAASMLTGTRDYRAFRSVDDTRENTIRTLHAIDIHECHDGDPKQIAIDVRGTAFMKNMVRILAGTLVDVGRGRLPLARVPALLGPDAQRDDAGQTAPAQGLTLMKVVLGRRMPSPFVDDSPG